MTTYTLLIETLSCYIVRVSWRGDGYNGGVQKRNFFLYLPAIMFVSTIHITIKINRPFIINLSGTATSPSGSRQAVLVHFRK